MRAMVQILPHDWMRRDMVMGVGVRGNRVDVGFIDGREVQKRQHVFETPEQALAWAKNLVSEMEDVADV